MPPGHAYVHVVAAPAVIRIADVKRLRIALSYYREGLNASSPFHGCLAFRNVLDAVFKVERETLNKLVTQQASARDGFVETEASRFAAEAFRPQQGWAIYFREEVRNAIAHVLRRRGEVDPDAPGDRVRFIGDARILKGLARAAIEQEWPSGVVIEKHRV